MTAHHERECKLDASSDAVITRVKDYVLSHPKIFMPVTKGSLLGVPKSLKFATPFEVTEPRIRLYWDDVNLTAQKNGIEIRQEPRPKGGIKQMVKVAGGAGPAKGVVMDRMEHSANLDHFGLDFDEIKDPDLRRHLKKLFGRKILKPVICMVSQRMKLNYHPGGDKKVLIELGLDAPCKGYVFDGYSWNNPQIELELVTGTNTKILEREAALLQKLFKLAPTTSSKPAVGFRHLQTLLATPQGKKAFSAHNGGVIWWDSK